LSIKPINTIKGLFRDSRSIFEPSTVPFPSFWTLSVQKEKRFPLKACYPVPKAYNKNRKTEKIAMAGFNSKIEHKGIIFLVQTQDLGRPSNCVESIIYKAGKALAPRKTFYTQHLNSPNLTATINRIIEQQHNAVKEAISEGKFDNG
jgi:hypothetical protein